MKSSVQFALKPGINCLNIISEYQFPAIVTNLLINHIPRMSNIQLKTKVCLRFSFSHMNKNKHTPGVHITDNCTGWTWRCWSSKKEPVIHSLLLIVVYINGDDARNKSFGISVLVYIWFRCSWLVKSSWWHRPRSTLSRVMRMRGYDDHAATTMLSLALPKILHGECRYQDKRIHKELESPRLINAQHNTTQPTRVDDKTSSVLDVILTSHPALHRKSAVLKYKLSDHYLIYTHMEFENTKPSVVDHNTVKFRDMTNFDMESFPMI